MTLLPPKTCIDSFFAKQFLVIALLHNLPLLQHADLISLHDRAEPVGNHQHGVLPFELVDGLLHQPFALGIEGAGGFIEN